MGWHPLIGEWSSAPKAIERKGKSVILTTYIFKAGAFHGFDELHINEQGLHLKAGNMWVKIIGGEVTHPKVIEHVAAPPAPASTPITVKQRVVREDALEWAREKLASLIDSRALKKFDEGWKVNNLIYDHLVNIRRLLQKESD